MGQQQLLLLVLATVIVGIATVVGINAYSQNNLKSNADQLANEAVRIASDVQSWVQKPEIFGGPATYGDLSLVTLAQMSYEAGDDGNTYVTPAGTCVYAAAGAADATVTCTNASLNNIAEVAITGLLEEDLDITMTIDGVEQ